MNNKKQTKQMVILAALLLALVIAVIMQFSGNKPTNSAPAQQAAPTQTAAAPTDAAAVQQQERGDLRWVDVSRLSGIITEVTYGHNPFLGAVNPAPIPLTVTKTTTDIQKQPSPVPTSSETLGGFPPKIATVTDKPFTPPLPPIPAFVLSGIVTTPSERYAGITVDGHYLTLLEGEEVPALGWTVTKITPDSVSLVKKKQSVTLRLSGGSPK